MSCKHLQSDYNIALPTAEIAVMGAEGAVDIVNRRDLENAENKEELKSKNDYYYKLYVDTNKGKNYEEELYPNILDYNDNYEDIII